MKERVLMSDERLVFKVEPSGRRKKHTVTFLNAVFFTREASRKRFLWDWLIGFDDVMSARDVKFLLTWTVKQLFPIIKSRVLN